MATKTRAEILRDIPLACVSSLSNIDISKIFGISVSSASQIMGDKFMNETDVSIKNKDYVYIDEMSIKTDNDWGRLKETVLYKQINKL